MRGNSSIISLIRKDTKMECLNDVVVFLALMWLPKRFQVAAQSMLELSERSLILLHLERCKRPLKLTASKMALMVVLVSEVKSWAMLLCRKDNCTVPRSYCCCQWATWVGLVARKKFARMSEVRLANVVLKSSGFSRVNVVVGLMVSLTASLCLQAILHGNWSR